MAQNITLMGASYSAVPAVTLPKTGGGTASFTDVTDTTAAAADVAAGKYFYSKDGVKTLGTGSGGGGDITVEALSVTQNGTYTAPTGTAYSPVTVNVSGGSSSWTKVAEITTQVAYSSTTADTVGSFWSGHSELWTSSKIVYVRIRDTAGPRAGYFYGSDTFFMNMYPQNESTTLSASTGLIYNIWRYESTGKYNCRYGYTNVGYGLYVDQISASGEVRVRVRYNRSYSLTIDGTYKVEVYLLDPPSGAPIFE